MDPAIAAALIATPTALVAAVAAYVAGQSQARAAHRGAVDAVRRQHQREVYVAFHTAATKYHDVLNVPVRLTSAGRLPADLPLDFPPTAGGAEVFRIAIKDALTTPLADLRRPGAAVELEGPDSVSSTVLAIPALAVPVCIALARWRDVSPTELNNDDFGFHEAHEAMGAAIDAFAKAARDHLNSHS